MKILLIGDFSGFHKNLKEGLDELGHIVHIAASGDGYKNTTNSDIYVPNSKYKIIKGLRKITFPFAHIKDYYGYDVVQANSHNAFGGAQIYYSSIQLKKIKKKTGKLFLTSCGTDYFMYKCRNELKYNPIDESINIDLSGKNRYLNKIYIQNNKDVANLVDGIIPITYIYRLAYNNHMNLMNTIQLPINSDKVKYIPQKIENNRLKIFHGITREGFKGTKYIREAMAKLKENYPNDVDIIIDGKMPLKDYLKVLEETNVVVDQALSYSYGMNAIYSMAMGKVVLSGNEPECQQEFGRSDIPVINIEPSVDDIYKKLEELLLNKSRVIDIGEKSRLFVEDFHHHVKVAQKYLDTWNSVEVRK